MYYRVNELFVTIQGEARYTGTPCLFIRMQGCGVGCPWCDTKHTWESHLLDTIDPPDLIALQSKDDQYWSFMTHDHLAEVTLTRGVKHVVITGGEPCDQDLIPLTKLLHDHRISVQVETSGTAKIMAYSEAWITLSPKIDMPGGLTVRQDATDRANEIKYPVGKQSDVDTLVAFLEEYKVHPDKKVWLQPLSQSPKATKVCIDACYTNNFNLSVQMHKYIGVA